MQADCRRFTFEICDVGIDYLTSFSSRAGQADPGVAKYRAPVAYSPLARRASQFLLRCFFSHIHCTLFPEGPLTIFALRTVFAHVAASRVDRHRYSIVWHRSGDSPERVQSTSLQWLARTQTRHRMQRRWLGCSLLSLRVIELRDGGR